ncbi:hypothetical protein PIB30_026303 [Stylosanthes scabra]|uniref:Uncharacterized protein n=1 Tax=Stylosanthes scabra TaxID=79078 RepID=A0ABU6V9W1_9FABA|nr:hypothetical protein [Stylosanthes scabra]
MCNCAMLLSHSLLNLTVIHIYRRSLTHGLTHYHSQLQDHQRQSSLPHFLLLTPPLPPALRCHPRVVALVPSSSPPSLSPIPELETEACRCRCLPLQNRFSPPSLSSTPDPELPKADSVSTPDLKLADMPSTPDTKLAVTLLYSRHRSSLSSPEARRSSHCLCTSRI